MEPGAGISGHRRTKTSDISVGPPLLHADEERCRSPPRTSVGNQPARQVTGLPRARPPYRIHSFFIFPFRNSRNDFRPPAQTAAPVDTAPAHELPRLPPHSKTNLAARAAREGFLRTGECSGLPDRSPTFRLRRRNRSIGQVTQYVVAWFSKEVHHGSVLIPPVA